MENSSSQQFYDELNTFIDNIPCNFQIYVQMYELKQQNINQIAIQSLTPLIDLFADHLKLNQFKLFLLGIRALLKGKCNLQEIQQQNANINYFQIQQNILTVFSQLVFKNKLTQIQIQIRVFIKSISENDSYELLQMVNDFSILNEQIAKQINEFEVFTQIYKLIDKQIQEYLFAKLSRILKQNLDQSFSSTSSKKRKRDESFKFDPNDLIDIKLPPNQNQSFEQNLNLSKIDQVMENELSFESDNQIIIQNSQQKSNIINQNVFEYKQIKRSQIIAQNEENQIYNDADEDYEQAIRNLFDNLNVSEDDKTQIKQQKEELKELIQNSNFPKKRKIIRRNNYDILSVNFQDFHNFNEDIQDKQFPCKLFYNLFNKDLYKSFIENNQIQIIFRIHPLLIYDYLKLTIKLQMITDLFEEVNVSFLIQNIENQMYFFQIQNFSMTDQEFKQKQQNHKQHLLKVSKNPELHNINQYFQCRKCKEIVLIKTVNDKNDEFKQYLIWAFPDFSHVDRQLIEHYLKHVVIVDQVYHRKHTLLYQIHQRDQINTITNCIGNFQSKTLCAKLKGNIVQKFQKLNQNYYVNQDYDIHFLSSEYFYSKLFIKENNFVLLSCQNDIKYINLEHMEEQYLFLRTFGYYQNGNLVLDITKDRRRFYRQLYTDLVEHLKRNQLKL